MEMSLEAAEARTQGQNMSYALMDEEKFFDLMVHELAGKLGLKAGARGMDGDDG